MMDENTDMGCNVVNVSKNQEKEVYKVLDSTGQGRMTFYDVFTGVTIIYNDFNMEQCNSEFQTMNDYFCVSHCKEGRLEWMLDDNRYMYMETGDLEIDTRANHANNFSFPLKCFQGITIAIDINLANKSLNTALEGFQINLKDLKKKFCSDTKPFIIRAGIEINHIFSGLYAVPKESHEIYFKIKVLELLFFLIKFDIPQNQKERQYFSKKQVEKIKRMTSFLTKHLENHYTLNELSTKFDFPLTSMKICFKGVYGISIYAYMKAYRMNTAAIEVIKTKKSIAEIGREMGYDNASKFSAAFKSQIGETPIKYRKLNV